ncbi:MAG: hypothetical protein HOL72_07330 [Euryarchaeota archaeon]|jgi:hypothetical protein|nr:hypothetical protein [Euryarchaeota archaeon]MBT5255559.1 hypothetical protein [Euryarchaeota archaeon]MDG1546524.1 hypothetical protein [Candidatus Poseidoniaceae archaeon]
MLQRVLAGLLRIEGVDQAMLIDDNGHLLASVGDEGILPPLEKAIKITTAALECAYASKIGDVFEIWCEGQERMMIDIASPNRIVVLSGKGGRLARWRHALDRDRRIIATIQMS